MATAKKKTAPKVTDTVDCSELKRLKETTYLESGNVGMDIVISDGKGIPLGANILMFGLPGTGKTTLICDILKRLLDKHKAQGIPFRVHYIDSESSRELLRSTGVMEYVYQSEEYAPQQVIYHEHINGLDQVEDIYKRMIDPKDIWGMNIYFTVIDSINKLSADTQLDPKGDINKGDYGDDARIRKKLEKKWFSVIQALDITQFWVSQMSTKQNVMNMFEDKKKPAVTDFDMHNMDVILKLTASKTENIDVKKVEYDTIQGKKEDVTKYLVRIDPGEKQYTKNRYGQNMSLNVMLWRGHKIINAYAIRTMLNEYGYLVDFNNKQSYSMSQELADFLGEEALEYAGITDIAKIPRKPNLNKLCSKYENKLIEFCHEHDVFRMKLQKEGAPEEEDDGLF